MPRCEITGIEQMMVKACPHPKCNGKYIGYLTCKKGLQKDGTYTHKCRYFIDGQDVLGNWCGYGKDDKNDK